MERGSWDDDGKLRDDGKLCDESSNYGILRKASKYGCMDEIQNAAGATTRGRLRHDDVEAIGKNELATLWYPETRAATRWNQVTAESIEADRVFSTSIGP